MPAPADVRERELAVVLVDLARFTQAVARLDSVETAVVVAAFYDAAAEVFARHRGRVVKFVGDACLAVFEPSDVLRALDAIESLRSRVRDVGRPHGLDLELGANVHVSTVAEGELGLDGAYEIIGAGVVHTFRMGSGAGTRISEPVYRRLPSDRRSPWLKHKPPVTYVWEGE